MQFSNVPMVKVSQKKFQTLLSRWYERHGRDLPWRNTHDPYRIWVSEIMLQQTQVDRVKEYYGRFLKRFPDVGHLARAPWEDVLECWRGLGYYRRARNMQKAAQVIVKEFGGKFPRDPRAIASQPRGYGELMKLPGIGSYTAAAIASFAFGEKVPALDTNISRVFARVFGGLWDKLKPGERFEFARQYIGALESRDFNYGLMDVGSAVCSSRQPKCGECCFQKICAYRRLGRVVDVQTVRAGRRAVRRQYVDGILTGFGGFALADAEPGRRGAGRLKGNRNVLKVTAGVLIHNGKVLIAKRPKGKPLAGLWEFPGGKMEPGEDERQCLKREFMEELGVEVAVRPHFHTTLVEYDGMLISLSFHRCSLLLGEVQSLENQEFQWVEAVELKNYEFPSGNDEVIDILLEKKAMFYV